MSEYQVWHKEGEQYKHVADVAAGDPQTAVLKTLHGLLANRWQDGQGVEAMPGEHRSTEFGDIVLAPDGTEYKFAAIRLEGHHGTLAGFEPTHELREQLYAEWQDDRKQRDLYDRSVDFADRHSVSLLAEIIGGRKEGDDGQALGQAASREATPLQRMERRIEELKARPEFIDPMYREIFDEGGVCEYEDYEMNLGRWDQLPHDIRLRELVYLDWDGVLPEDRTALLEREVDFAKVTERKQREIMGEAGRDLAKPEPSEYQRALQAAIRQAKHRADEPDRGPTR